MTNDKRFMIYLQAVKCSYVNFEMDDIAYIHSVDRNADALTKIKNELILMKTPRSCILL